jgi:hypothetical protein
LSVLHYYIVLKLCIISQFTPDSLPQDINILLFQILIKKWAGDLNGENVVVQFQRYNGLKPGLKTDRWNNVPDYVETVIPYFMMSLVHVGR